MPRLKLLLAYEGTRYAGWQLQAFKRRAQPPTVQGELEKALAAVTGQRHPVLAAGRTDAGVHAEGQVCHVDLPEGKEHVNWQRALNVKLPPDIRVLKADWTTESFHARKSARAKRYAYSLWMHRDRALPRIRAFVWSTPPLDTDGMAQAFPLLCGRRDFASFRNSGTPQEDAVRCLHSITWLPGMLASLSCPAQWPVGTLVFEGDGFLKQMVRNLCGLLVWVGLGKLDAGRIPDILAAADRRALPSPSAPASGLTLMEVFY